MPTAQPAHILAYHAVTLMALRGFESFERHAMEITEVSWVCRAARQHTMDLSVWLGRAGCAPCRWGVHMSRRVGDETMIGQCYMQGSGYENAEEKGTHTVLHRHHTATSISTASQPWSRFGTQCPTIAICRVH
jgi:hypothetical protein